MDFDLRQREIYGSGPATATERGPGGAGGLGATAHEAVLEQKWAEVQRVGLQHKLVGEYGDTESVRGRRPRSPFTGSS